MTPRKGAFLCPEVESLVNRRVDWRMASSPQVTDEKTVRSARLVTLRADCFTGGLGLEAKQVSSTFAFAAIMSNTTESGVSESLLRACKITEHHSSSTSAEVDDNADLDASACSFCVRYFRSSVGTGVLRSERRHC